MYVESNRLSCRNTWGHRISCLDTHMEKTCPVSHQLALSANQKKGLDTQPEQPKNRLKAGLLRIQSF
jgi:hypothetical protein